MKRLGVFAVVCTAGILSSALSLSHTGAQTTQGVFIRTGALADSVTSSNWSGYAVQTNLSSPQSNVVTDVKGQWVVPTATCPGGTQYSSAWVGIDGYSDGTVQQEGTEADCQGTTPAYYSWYELCCIEPSIRTPMAVHPGDTITAETKYAGGSSYTMILHNVTTGGSFTKTQSISGALRNSAEWIVEAPFSGGILPLADFGNLIITHAQATISGHTGVISDGAWQNTAIDMGTTTHLKDKTSPLGASGSAFLVHWLASQ